MGFLVSRHLPPNRVDSSRRLRNNPSMCARYRLRSPADLLAVRFGYRELSTYRRAVSYITNATEPLPIPSCTCVRDSKRRLQTEI
jgi:hypothetical protein